MQSNNPIWKQQWVQRLVASMSLVAALTVALIAITPLLAGHPNWLQIIFLFLVVFVFAVLHSLTVTIPDPALRAALSAVLDKLEQILQQLNSLKPSQSVGIARSTIADTDTRSHPAVGPSTYRQPPL